MLVHGDQNFSFAPSFTVLKYKKCVKKVDFGFVMEAINTMQFSEGILHLLLLHLFDFVYCQFFLRHSFKTFTVIKTNFSFNMSLSVSVCELWANQDSNLH